MRIALIGVSGRVGSRLLAELLSRGHSVTGIARSADGVVPRASLVVKTADATNQAQLAPLLAAHDAVISATRFVSTDPKALIAAVKQSGVTRLLVVGGGGVRRATAWRPPACIHRHWSAKNSATWLSSLGKNAKRSKPGGLAEASPAADGSGKVGCAMKAKCPAPATVLT
jgi:hypothetical protein